MSDVKSESTHGQFVRMSVYCLLVRVHCKCFTQQYAYHNDNIILQNKLICLFQLNKRGDNNIRTAPRACTLTVQIPCV